MKFIRATIYGFGKWIDQEIHFSDENLVAFYGENESGKTTLQQFIMYVLFGLPPRKLALYQPLHSHKIGGRLYVENTANGPFIIERIDQKLICYLNNGKEKDEAWLQSELKGLNRQVFESIYAFSALDLVKIKQMKQEDMSNILFSVGLTGSTVIYEAEKKLDKKIAALFKKTGTKPIMNQQITATQEAHHYTIDTQKKEAVYQEKQRALRRAQEEKAQEEIDTSKLQASLLKKEKYQSFLPQLEQYRIYEKQLEAMPKEQAFPEDGISRLEKIKEQSLPTQSELQTTNHRLVQLQEEKIAYEKALYDEQVIEDMKKTINKRANYEHALEQNKTLTFEVHRLQELIEGKIETTQLTIAEIEELSLPFHLDTEWQYLKERQQNLLQLEERQTKQYESLQKKVENLTKEKSRTEEKLLSESEIKQLQNEQQNFNDQTKIEQNEWKHSSWKAKQMKISKGILIGASIVSLISILFAFFTENFTLFIIPFLLFLVAGAQFFQTKRVIDFMARSKLEGEQSERPIDIYADQYRLLEEQNTLKTKLEALEIQLKQVEEEQHDWQEQQNNFLIQENEWIQAIEEMKQTYYFLNEVDVPYWTDLLLLLREIKKDLLEQKHIKRRLKKVSEVIQHTEAALANHTASLPLDDKLTFNQLEAIIQGQQTNEHFITERKEQIQAHKSEINRLKKQKEMYEDELQALFSVANVKTEEEFLQVANQLIKRQEIEFAIDQISQQLSAMFSKNEVNELIRTNIVAHKLEHSIEQLRNQLQKNKTKQVTLNKQITTLELEIKELEKSDDHSTAVYRQQMKEDTLQQHADEWAILKIARATLEQAKINYQEHHLQSVLEYTSTFFAELTNGRYDKVYAPTSKSPFQVEGKDHIIYTIDMLSQGTVDQLYIALRLAISIVMSDRYHMPFIIDDAFVHFDETRTNRMLGILQNWAKEQQIIIFTCKKSVARQLNTVNLTL